MLTCPPACPFKAGGCYAGGGPALIWWKRLSEGKTGLAWVEFLEEICGLPAGQLWRHDVAGDLAGQGNRIHARALSQLVAANAGRRGFTYTHKPVLGEGRIAKANRKAVAAANAAGFTVNLSANTLLHADELLALKIGPVAAVVPADVTANTHTPGGARVVVCPATVRDEVTCAKCGLCQRAGREYVIAFPAHGFQAKKAGAIAAG